MCLQHLKNLQHYMKAIPPQQSYKEYVKVYKEQYERQLRRVKEEE